MNTYEFTLADDLDALYQSEADPEFARILERFSVRDDRALADLIEADGRLRLRNGQPVQLDRYLDAVPGLAEMPEPVDAAIDMALRALGRSDHSFEHLVDSLVRRFPEIGHSIREAAVLNDALWSTEHIHRRLAISVSPECPRDFGPLLDNSEHRYRLKELLGHGAFGQVYLAVDRQLSDEGHLALVAIKVLPGDDCLGWMQHQLADEATKARRITQPNVVRVLDRGISERNEAYLVYEFVDGGDLARLARHNKSVFRIEHAVRLVIKVARGVHAAHMVGLVHCDLKPNNILLTSDGQPKVADFGIAIRADDSGMSKRPDKDSRGPLGNLAFMSPEQYRMEPGALTIPTDVYALGGILYWLLTGILPNGSTPEMVRRTHDPVGGRTVPPPLREHRPEVDRDLEAVCNRAMAVRPDDRFHSAAGLAESLEAWSRREPIPWTRPSIPRKVKLWVARKPALAVASALLVLLVVASGTALRYLASVASQRRFEAAIAETRLEQERHYRDKFRADLIGFIDRSKEAREHGLADQLIPQIWIVEWLYGPTVLGDGAERFELWDMRVDVIRNHVRAANAAGRGYEFQTLLWESALGFWLTENGDHQEAAPLLQENVAKWSALVEPGDPWLDHLKAMIACTTVLRALEPGPAPTEIRQDLVAIEPTLDEAERQLNATAPGSPLHRLVLRHMRQLYESGLIDRPRRLQEVKETLRTMTE